MRALTLPLQVMNMRRIGCFILGAATTLTIAACGSDDSAGTHGTGGSSASGNSSTGGVASGTGGTGTATGGAAAATGGKAATGGTSTTTGGSGGATGNVCQTACQKLLTVSCGDLTQADCTDGCPTPTACVAESNSYYGCINSKGTPSCEAMETFVAGCDTEGTAFSLCTVCLPQTGDSSCVACTRSSCCSEVKTYISAADADVYDACVSPCTTQDCVDTCAAASPIAGKADSAINDCQVTSCVDTCVCGPNADDSTCVACVKTSCCADFATYAAASDIGAFSTCTAACADTDAACFDACVTAHPVAGAAYDNLITNCVSTTCASSCGG